MNAILIVSISFSTIILASSSSQRRCQNTQFECDNGQCISKSNWCKTVQSWLRCSDNSHIRNCGSYNNCYQNQRVCTSDKKCIPSKWFCDGYQDCTDNSDENDCWIKYKISGLYGVTNARQNALNWLLKQRRSNWGWEDDTSRAIVSLYFANNRQFEPGDTNSQLMVKQMQIQLSKMLLKNGTSSIPAHQLALYIHALLATCLNPRSFQGYNLVEELKHKIDRSDSFNPFLALALCNSNETLSPKHIVQLIEVMNRPRKPEWTDSQAFSAIALICLQNHMINYPSKTISITDDNNTSYSYDNNTSYQMDDASYYIKIVIPLNLTYNINVTNMTSVFTGLQHENGSFGSIYTTALAVQALIAAKQPEHNWDLKKAIQYLLSQQKKDGSFANILSTYLVLPLLYDQTFLNLGNISCLSTGSLLRNLTVKEELDSIRSMKQRVEYSIWLGIHKDVSFSISLTIPVNKTFYDVMRLAEELDQRYRFEYFQYFWGKYVFSIFGVVNDPEARKYWQFYRVEEEKAIFIDKTPDNVIPEKNGRYAYWYRPTNHVISTR